MQLNLNPNKDKPQFVPEDVKPKRIRKKPRITRAESKELNRRDRYAEPIKPWQALGITNDWVEGHYVPGDGDVLQIRRAGSDHSRYKSKGVPT